MTTPPSYAGLGTALQTMDTYGTPDIVSMARAAEAAGLDHVWIPDHLLFHRAILEAFTAASVVAGATERVKLGFAVLNGVLRPPVWFAKQLATLSVLSGERIAGVGIGVGGEYAPEFEAAGVPVKGRGKRLNEMLDELPSMLAGETGIGPVPQARPPVLIGGRAEAALRRCAKYGDAWLPMWMDSDKVASLHAEIGEMAKEFDRPAPGLSYLAFVNVTDDPAKGREEAAELAKKQYGMPFEKVERWALVGDPDEVAGRLRAYQDIGATGFVLMPATPDPTNQVDGLAAVKELLGV